MAHRMPHPWKDKKTGMFHIRVRVPRDLEAAFGKKFFKRSLGTKDPKTATARFADEFGKFTHRCAALRSTDCGRSEPTLECQITTEIEALKFVEPIYRKRIARYRDNPSAQTDWKTELFGELWKAPPDTKRQTAAASRDGTKGTAPESFGCPELWDHMFRPAGRLERICRDEVDWLLAQNGMFATPPTIAKLERATGIAIQQAALYLERLAQGEFTDDTSVTPAGTGSPGSVGKAVEFSEVFQRWQAEAHPKEKTAYEWRRILEKLREYVDTNDFGTVRQKDVLAWKDSLVASGLAAKTINDTYLSAVRTICAWACNNGLLPANPAAAVRVRQMSRVKSVRGFDDAEAAKILEAAQADPRPEYRWVPLLMAYSGARLTEVAQLRREDIDLDGLIPTMRFDPGAGSLKTKGSERIVPLHPAILCAGFIDFARNARGGPLFTGFAEDRYGNRGGTATKRLGPWIRSLGVEDERLSPDHSWRHRFKTLARDFDLQTDITDALLGHAPASVGARYGSRSLAVLKRELCKIPAIEHPSCKHASGLAAT